MNTIAKKLSLFAAIVLLLISADCFAGDTNSPPSTGGETKTGALAYVGYLAAILGGFFTWMQNREKRKAIEAAKGAEHKVQTLVRENEALQVTAKELEGKLLFVKKGITEPVETPLGEYRNLIMILGLGGSGKSAVIRTIFNNKSANPSEETKEKKLFRSEIPFGGSGPSGHSNQKIHIFACDYRGQDLSTFTRTFVEQQQALYSQMAYGHINSLILVVDLRHPGLPGAREDVPLTEKPDEDRIQKHLEAWNQTALDAIAGFVTADRLKFVCLYINKIDRIRKNSEDDREAYKMMFELLRARLEKRFSPVKVSIIVGSAKSGDGSVDLRQGLEESSVLVESDNNTKQVRI